MPVPTPTPAPTPTPGPTPTPAPTPTPGPTPSPTPTPTPPPTPLASVVEGLPGGTAVQSAGVTNLADGRAGHCAHSGLCYGGRALGDGPTVTYLVDPQSIEISGDSSHTFGSADTTSDGTSTFATYVNFDGTDPGSGDDFRLTLYRPSVNGVPLTYTRFASYLHIGSNHVLVDSSLFAFGVLTEQMPKRGAATYSTTYNANIQDGTGARYIADNTTGSATFSADFGSGDVTISIDLDNARKADAPGSLKSFGVMTGTGSIVYGGPGFDGSFTDLGSSGEFDGAFFGPKAAEIGMAFDVERSDFVADGIVAGKKN